MKKLILLIFIILLLIINFDFSQEKKIREDVVVVNVEVPVRVMFKGKPVDNLKKSDFRLFENGKEQEINGFFMVRKKIKDHGYDLSTERTEKFKPRYFVLAFRVYQFTDQLNKAIDYTFGNILKESDKLLIFINNKTLFFEKITDTKVITGIVKRNLRIESENARIRFEKAFLKISNDLERAKFLSGLDKANIGGGDVRIDPLQAKRFFENYTEILKSYRKQFLTPDINVYYNFAKHLEKIDLEKWVITFYQFEKFPAVKITGKMAAALGGKLIISNRMVKMVDDFPSEEISKLFYKVNTTFHSLFFSTYNDINSPELKFSEISTDLENSFREITKKTGGELIISNKLDLSLEKIVEREDIYYMLTYSPEKSGKTGKIKVKLKNSKYSVYFDNNMRKDYITEYLRKREAEISEVKLEEFGFSEKKISLRIGDIMFGKEAGSRFGKVRVHILIKNSKGENLFDKKKILTAKKSEININIGMNWLEPGMYDLMVDVTDLLSGRSAFEYKKIEVK